MRDAVERRLDDFSERSGISELIEKSDAVIVAFSGGADSSLLLDIATKKYKDKKVCAAHFNHMIRGAEADSDALFCRERCKRFDVEFFEDFADIPKLSKEMKCGTEECARKLRYAFLVKCRKNLAARLDIPESRVLIATAHNADDNLETLIFNMTRGSALRGLAGIPPVRDGIYIRPLLCLGSEEIRNLCTEMGIDFVVDSTNAENEYARNRIRHDAVPILRSINPSVHLSALRCSEAVARDEKYLEAETLKALGEYATADAAPSKLLCGMEMSILSRALIALYKNVSDKELSSSHVDKLIELLFKSGSAEYHLPDNITAYIGDEFKLVREETKERVCSPDFEFVLTDPMGDMEKLGFVLSLYDINRQKGHEEPNVYNSLINRAFINDKIKGTLIVRNRREHDVYKYGGHTRKVKKLFCDRKIPLESRSRIPLVCDDDGILWIPGFPPRDSSRASEKDARFILTYRITEEEK